MLSFSINSSCFIITFAVTSNSYGRVGWLNQRMSEPLKPRPQWFGKSLVLNHFAHAGGGRNWMTGPDLAHHRWIKSFIPNWQHTLLGLSMCQAYFCIHPSIHPFLHTWILVWYPMVKRYEQTALKLWVFKMFSWKGFSILFWFLYIFYVSLNIFQYFSSEHTAVS